MPNNGDRMTALRGALERDSERLRALGQRTIFITSGVFQEDLGVLGFASDHLARQAELLDDRGLTTRLWDALMALLESDGQAQVINLTTLIGILGSSWEDQDLKAALSNARVTVYGTDGSRGEVRAENSPASEALLRKLRDQEMVPRFFEQLVAASIRTLRSRGFIIENVPVGWDTRDLFVDEGQGGIFRRAIIDGVTLTGANALVMGVTPIANSSYILGALQGAYPGLALSFNKTASHNPPSHDGLKSFCVDPTASPFAVRKLSPLEEAEITAWLFAAAILECKDPGQRGREIDLSERSTQLLKDVFGSHKNRGTLDGETWQSFALVYDGSNGAAASEAMVTVLRNVFQSHVDENTSLQFLSCEPNGRNINDHCGAGALEGCEELEESTVHESFGEFQSIQAVWNKGHGRHQESKKDGALAIGLATDGDSDRSYVFFYDPFKNRLRFLDGDAAILLQVQDGLDRGLLKPGHSVAFTIESAATFAEELIRRAREKGPASFVLYGQEPEKDSIQFVMTPVGDKWVLSMGPSIGGEATGHIIRPVALTSAAGEHYEIHAGNGPLGLVATAAAIERTIAGLSGQALEAALDRLVNPYPKGCSLTTYAYFVERGRFYRNGRIWGELREILERILDAHTAPFDRQTSTFDDDPNTLLIVLRDDAEVVCSLHVRCSGTEAKIGLKASAADRRAFHELFKALDDEVFFLLARTLRDESSIYWQRQARVLQALLIEKLTWAQIQKRLSDTGSPGALFESQNRFLASALSKQRLVVKDPKGWSLTARGQMYAKALGDWT
jgi:phosphomannomutase